MKGIHVEGDQFHHIPNLSTTDSEGSLENQEASHLLQNSQALTCSCIVLLLWAISPQCMFLAEKPVMVMPLNAREHSLILLVEIVIV